MCDIWKYPTEPETEIKPSVLEKLPDGLGRINLTGGEPMLREDIEDVVKVLYGKCGLLEISTNGYYTDKIIRIAEKYPKVMVRVSIEGLPELNDRLRGLRNGFDHALRTILALKKTKVRDIGFSIVICDRNAADLLAVYELCSLLGVEFGNSTMQNSWYFHKTDNLVADRELAAATDKGFIKALLGSRRKGWALRVKDWLRAYFNLNILKHLQGGGNILASCCAGKDLFFVDPAGNILPCNGSEEQWIMGNLNEASFREIWASDKAAEARKRVDACQRQCAYIQTARVDMRKNPLRPILWILQSKLRLMAGKEPDYL
jgi:Fe-coproporphyrin III synthase